MVTRGSFYDVVCVGGSTAGAAQVRGLGLGRRAFDYGELDQWMQNDDAAIRQTRRVLERIKGWKGPMIAWEPIIPVYSGV